MSVEIFEVHFGGYFKSEDTITQYKWRNLAGQSDVAEKAAMVAWIEAGNQAFVGSGNQRVAVRVVNASPKYLRTDPDIWGTNNLLSLPTF